MRITLFVNSAKTFFWHRRSLADKLIYEGHDVFIVCSLDDSIEEFESSKYKTVFIPFSRKGVNPFKELRVLFETYKVFKQIDPDICHNFTIKCVIYGSLVQKFLSIPKIVNSITGLGIVFTRPGLRQEIIKKIYKFTFWYSQSKIIFQNEDDMQFFQKEKIVLHNSTKLVPGSGVNTEVFRACIQEFEVPRMVFASRLIRSKGLIDLLNASVKLAENNFIHEFLVAGEFDDKSADTLRDIDLEPFKKYGHIKFLGNVKDMPGLLGRCHIACFPSYYREGVPKFLIESASSGLAIVTSDAPGCKVVVENNGILVRPRDCESLYNALKILIQNPHKIIEFGQNSRVLALRKFSETIILKEITEFYFE